MLSFGTARRALTPPYLSTRAQFDLTFLTFLVLVQGAKNTARQATDGLWTEARGQQKQSNDPGNNQHILKTPIIGRR